MSALVRASARALPRRTLSLQLAGALVLIAVSLRGLDQDSTAVLVLRGVVLLLAATLALALDEAGAALLDASPTPLHRRVGARLVLCVALVAPVWAAALAVVALRGGAVPAAALTLELAALTAVGLAVAAGLRRWQRVAEPALVVGPLLAGGLLAAAHLPREAALLAGTALDPAWEAAHWRWAGLLLVSLALVVLALAEPATARAAGRLRARGPSPC